MASGHDMKSANQTYGGFLSLVKVGTIVYVLTVAFVIFLIA